MTWGENSRVTHSPPGKQLLLNSFRTSPTALQLPKPRAHPPMPWGCELTALHCSWPPPIHPPPLTPPPLPVQMAPTLGREAESPLASSPLTLR